MKILDSTKLKKADPVILSRLTNTFRKFGFTHEKIKRYTGKSVVRYTKLFPDDHSYLLNQVFVDADPLGTLYRLFLLGTATKKNEIEKVMDSDTITHLITIDILRQLPGEEVVATAFITPVSDVWVLNDGRNRYNNKRNCVFQIGAEQPYLLSVARLITGGGEEYSLSSFDS